MTTSHAPLITLPVPDYNSVIFETWATDLGDFTIDSVTQNTGTFQATVVPEPASSSLMVVALASLAAFRRRV